MVDATARCVICDRPFVPRIWWDRAGLGHLTRTCRRWCTNQLVTRLRVRNQARQLAAPTEGR